jgi:hypothetical protein
MQVAYAAGRRVGGANFCHGIANDGSAEESGDKAPYDDGGAAILDARRGKDDGGRDWDAREKRETKREGMLVKKKGATADSNTRTVAVQCGDKRGIERM